MKRIQRAFALILTLILSLGLTLPAAGAAFADVAPDAWYAADVSDVQRYGILQGVGDNRFNPQGTMTLAEAITMASRTRAYSRGETIPAGRSSTLWYQPYVSDAAEAGICARGEFGTGYGAPCSRLIMAKLFDRVLPEGTKAKRNTVSVLPDLPNTPANRSVYSLYEQGVLTGSDEYGTFLPDSSVTRAEAAAILNRVLDPARRRTFTLRSTTISGDVLEVWYIDVGQADAALVLCGGHSMLIDGGNAADSNLIYTFLKKRNVSYLDYIVCTHAHEDHVGGLAGALNYAAAGRAFCPVTAYDSKAFSSFTAYLARQGLSITVPRAGDTFSLGSANVQVVGPIRPSEEPNNTSLVLRADFGSTSFLFTGDAEQEEEQDILNAGYSLRSTVLKVGHHGSGTSTSAAFLQTVRPQYAVISVGSDNSYGHPAAGTLRKLREAGVTVYRTDLQGDIHCVSDGEAVTFTVSKNAGADTLTAPGASSQSSAGVQTYVLNTGSHRFHYPSCSSVGKISAGNRAERTAARETLLAEGYTPCGICKP